jgi:hypothetical protein
MSPDWSVTLVLVPYADFQNPQTLNLYGYVVNNPLTHADLDGHGILESLERAAANVGQALKQAGQAIGSAYATAAGAVARTYAKAANAAGSGLHQGYGAGAKGLSENPNFSFSHISGKDLNNMGKNTTLLLAGQLAVGAEAGALERGIVGTAVSRGPALIGFSESESAMIAQSLKNLSGAGYDISPIQQLVKAQMGNKVAMSLSTSPTGVALSESAFESQGFLDHTMEEELRHLGQDLSRQEFGPGTPAQKESEVDANRKFPDPRQRN